MQKSMKPRFPLILLILGSLLGVQPLVAQPDSQRLYQYVPLSADMDKSQQYKWDHKPIANSTVVDRMESIENWTVKSLQAKQPTATGQLSDEQVFEGKQSIKFTSPTKLPFRLKTGERYWDWQFLTRTVPKQDWSAYNRISVQIYPDFKGHRTAYLMLILANEDNLPDKYFREGVHTFMLKNHQWNRVVMEIAHLPRNKVTGISLVYRMQGNEADAADTIAYYVDRLALETVHADPYKGWNTTDAIAYSHVGYTPESRKTAFTSQAGPAQFRLVDVRTGKPVLTKKVVRQTSYAGTFNIFDFSGFRRQGTYQLSFGTLKTQPFPIGPNVWLPTLEKSVNQFFVQRCGYALPDIHGICHRDWYTLFKGDTIRLTGGWHDAGDLSQSFTNTANATSILFKLARKYQLSNPKLADRLLAEGLWGLTWLHTNRFAGGKRVGWSEIDHYTDDRLGNDDDVAVPEPADSRGVESFYSVLANVNAALALKNSQPTLSQTALQYALEDWRYATQSARWSSTDRLAMAVSAGAALFQLTGLSAVKDQIIGYAAQLLDLQQKQPQNWTIPLRGFFYQNTDRNRVFGYNHHFVVASPIDGLVALTELFPEHPGYPDWHQAIKSYADYLRTIAQITAPYYMVPANIYILGYTNDGVSVAEGDRQARKGIKLDETHYLRMFPVWGMFRGNNPNVLSRGIGLASANRVLHDPELEHIARSQLEWVVGKNPFGQSQLYGEGHLFSPQYAVMTGDIVGGIPVGILTQGDNDEPYCQSAIFCNYKEIWGHCSIRFLELLDQLEP